MAWPGDPPQDTSPHPLHSRRLANPAIKPSRAPIQPPITRPFVNPLPRTCSEETSSHGMRRIVVAESPGAQW